MGICISSTSDTGVDSSVECEGGKARSIPTQTQPEFEIKPLCLEGPEARSPLQMECTSKHEGCDEQQDGWRTSEYDEMTDAQFTSANVMMGSKPIKKQESRAQEGKSSFMGSTSLSTRFEVEESATFVLPEGDLQYFVPLLSDPSDSTIIRRRDMRLRFNTVKPQVLQTKFGSNYSI